jgi:arginase
MMEKIAVIGVPSSAGARNTGQDRAPESMRKAGLLTFLASAVPELADFGDLPLVRYARDPDQPTQQNVSLAGAVIRQLARRTERAVASRRSPFILGGDCTITIGAVAGLLQKHPDLALIYFDGDIDMNVPEDSPSGILDGMVLAHMTGLGNPELSRAGRRDPLLAEQDIVAFGYNDRSGFIDAGEFKRFQKSAIHKYAADGIRGNAAAEASNALEAVGGQRRPFLLHFDVDVMDESAFPAADVPHRYGMELTDVREALRVFLQSPACAGFVITEFNADRDPDGSQSRILVDLISRAIHR